MRVAVMAKSKPKTNEGRRKPIAATLKGSDEWKQWLEEAASSTGLTVASFLDQAIREYAKLRGFNRQPPAR